MRTPQQKKGKTNPEQHANTPPPQNENSNAEKPAKKDRPSEIWLVIGTMRYGSKKTENELNKRAKKILDSPYEYSHDFMGKRKLWQYFHYKFVINTADIIHALEVSERKAQRLLQITREKLNKNKNDYVSVKEFCDLHKLNETEIRKKIVRQPSK